MRMGLLWAAGVVLVLLGGGAASALPAPDQLRPGAGNARAAKLAEHAPPVVGAVRLLAARAAQIHDPGLRAATLEILEDPRACVHSRARVDARREQALARELEAAGLLDPKEGIRIPGGLIAGLFPPLAGDGSACPRLPQPFFAAPGSGNGSHHTYPGGLALHEAWNELAMGALAAQYRRLYGPEVSFDPDLLIAAPIWHDWAKTYVFQWNADGSEFTELTIAGTGAHHILGLAEQMSRALPPALVVATASAHAAPALGGEVKVASWLRAAALLAGVDPVARGYLVRRPGGQLEVPPFTPIEALHHLSDGDYVLTIPAARSVDALLARIGPAYGFSPADRAGYAFGFRDPILSQLTAERLFFVFERGGKSAVEAQIKALHARGLF